MPVFVHKKLLVIRCIVGKQFKLGLLLRNKLFIVSFKAGSNVSWLLVQKSSIKERGKAGNVVN